MGMVTTPFDDLDEFLALPRMSGLAVSPDGSRVVTSIAELNEKRTEFVSAIWEARSGRPSSRRVASPAERRVSRHRLSLPTAICCSSRRGRPRRTTSRPRRCGDYPPQAGKPSRRWRCRVASRAFAPRVRPPPRWSPRSCCARRPASTRTSDCEHCARTTRCQLFCTAVTRCVTGITTSGPTTRICSTSTDHAISPRSPGTRCGRRTSTSAPMAASS